MASRNTKTQLATAVWTGRIIPILLAGAVGYATYVFTVRLCIHFLLYNDVVTYRSRPAAIGLLTAYYILLLPMSACYLRLVYTVNFDPGYLPTNVEKPPTSGSTISIACEKKRTFYKPDTYAQSVTPFYYKQAFVCQQDGRQAYCSHCRVNKPDRTHHCSDVGRCVRKMDHFCPWVGGVVAETSFKFFVQFVTYAWIYCLYVLVVAAIYLAMQHTSSDLQLDPQIAVMLGLAGFFGLFTLGMSSSSAQFAVENLTTIQNLGRKTHTYMIAISIPRETPVEIVDAIRNDGFVIKCFDTVLEASSSTLETNHTLSEPTSQPQFISSTTRSFVIVQLEKGENPWHLGSWLLNWKSVMGDDIWSWILPVRKSPTNKRARTCTGSTLEYGEVLESEFPFGPAVEKYRKRFGLDGGMS